ncbi:MAG: hypothetical protein HC793_00265 [Aquincola sp.]|nr:hypothetical protein [Aquincola sp.]
MGLNRRSEPLPIVACPRLEQKRDEQIALSPSNARCARSRYKRVVRDQAIHARAVAEHLGTDHTELYIRGKDAQSIIPELPSEAWLEGAGIQPSEFDDWLRRVKSRYLVACEELRLG